MEDSTPPYFLRLLFAFTMLTPLKLCVLAQIGDSLSLGDSLAGNQTMISRNGTFALGFFSPGETNNWYLGIWYAQVPEKTVVWVANRQTPLKNTPAVLKLSRDGQLGLFDVDGLSFWWVNGTNKASGAVLLDSGNFIMLGAEGKSESVWESFEHPADTWLPGMKIGGDRKLISWKNSMDPAPGTFSLSFGMDSSGGVQLALRWKHSVTYWNSGAWNGEVFVGIPEMKKNYTAYDFSTEETGSIVYFIYRNPSVNYLSRFVMDKAGGLLLNFLIDGNRWNMVWSAPSDQCQVYGLCGAFGICDSKMNQFCSCLRGFKPRDEKAWDWQEWWSSGCVPRNPFICDAKNGANDEFIDMDASLPDNQAYSYTAQTRKECKNACLNNCSCVAFNYMGNICQIRRGALLNMRNTQPKTKPTLFVRVAASEFGISSSSKGRRSNIAPVIGGVVACAIVLTILACFFWRKCWMIAKQRWAQAFGACLALRFTVASRCTRSEAEEVDATSSIRTFAYKELQISTRGFTHKLGSGAFGSVFRGTLPNGTLVAIKKLQGKGQGEKEFRAEINTLGNIHHVNLIRLRGFCAEKSRRLLIYDYMPKGSLNTLLFRNKSRNERKVDDWKIRFEIALGVARGLVYLHEECKERIIHCDIKPENILLDGNFCPKLADFGLAKLVGRDFSRVLTTTRGTRGYLAPEWISGLPITPKADVYSFGMTLLEIISGRRNLDLSVQESSKFYFPTWAAAQIHKEDIMSVVDSGIANSADEEEVRRAAVVSMLCIQDDEGERPSMGQVLLMLEGKTELRTPQLPRSLFSLVGRGGSEDSCTDYTS